MVKGAIWLVVGALAMAGLISGCGGDSDEATASLTKAEFVQQGNALCKKHEETRNGEIEDVFSKLEPGDELSDPRQAKMVESIIIPSYEGMISDIKSLTPPAGDEDKIDEIIVSMGKTLKGLKADPEEAVFTTVMFDPPNKLVRNYGLSNCAF